MLPEPVATQQAADGDWAKFHKRFSVLGLPQVPDETVAASFAAQIAGHDDRVLLLGITRVITGLGRDLTAVDWSEAQIDKLWPGDTPERRAIMSDWREMDLPEAHFTSVMGDGSFSAVTWRDDYIDVMKKVTPSLAPGAKLVIRCFVAPDERETLGQIADDVHAGKEPSFHAARWRVAMAACDDAGNVVVGDIHRAFSETFPDWPGIAEKAGWDLYAIETILGSFENSPLVYSFVPRAKLIEGLGDGFTNIRFEPSGTYPLAERCPFLVAERAA